MKFGSIIALALAATFATGNLAFAEKCKGSKDINTVATKVEKKAAAEADIVDTAVNAGGIVDFKTDARDPQDPASVSAKREFYQPQLRAYSEAVSRLYNLPLARVRARVAFVQSELIVDGSSK